MYQKHTKIHNIHYTIYCTHLSEQLHSLGVGSLGLGAAVQEVRLVAEQTLLMVWVECGVVLNGENRNILVEIDALKKYKNSE